jgi:hypothetical protein
MRDDTPMAATAHRLALHRDRLLPVDPQTRALAREIYAAGLDALGVGDEPLSDDRSREVWRTLWSSGRSST